MIPQPEFKIQYKGKDVTADVTPYYVSCEYTDHTEGTSDEITITLEDTDALWRGPWYPEKGATLTLEIKYQDKTLKCGTFEVDEIEQSGPPHMVTIKALAAGIQKAIRTKSSQKYDQTTLKGIAQKIASKHGFTVQGQIDNINIERSTQYRQKDLEYLRELSLEYGYVFSIREKKLIFTSIFDLEKTPGVLDLDLTEMTSYTFRDKAIEVYKESKVSYRDPKTSKTITGKATSEEITNKDGIGFAVAGAADKANTFVRAENPQQAQVKAKALLYRKNMKQNEGTITLDGNTDMVAGININITGLGVLSGRYHILKSSHSIDRSSGYTTSIDVKRVGGAKDKKSQAAKKPVRAKQPVPTAAPIQGSTTGLTNRDGITFNTSGGNA